MEQNTILVVVQGKRRFANLCRVLWKQKGQVSLADHLSKNGNIVYFLSQTKLMAENCRNIHAREMESFLARLWDL